MRIEPNLPAHLYKTYEIRAPLKTHWRKATCEEVRCPDYERGWKTTVDESTDLGKRQAHYIRHDRTRKHAENRLPSGLTEFTFSPGQTCFDSHKTRLEIDEIFVERGGDWRGNPRREGRMHTNAEFWVESFAEHQDKLKTALERG